MTQHCFFIIRSIILILPIGWSWFLRDTRSRRCQSGTIIRVGLHRWNDCRTVTTVTTTASIGLVTGDRVTTTNIHSTGTSRGNRRIRLLRRDDRYKLNQTHGNTYKLYRNDNETYDEYPLRCGWCRHHHRHACGCLNICCRSNSHHSPNDYTLYVSLYLVIECDTVIYTPLIDQTEEMR